LKKTLIVFLERRKTMKPEQKQAMTEHLIAAMTAGLTHSGAIYKIPESIALEYGRLCHNYAINRVIAMFRGSDFGQTGLEIMDSIQELHILQRDERICPPCDGECNEGRNCPARKA
jgi:hypothetical protein